MVMSPIVLHSTLVLGAVAVTCPEHLRVWNDKYLSPPLDTECAAGQFCARIMGSLDGGRRSLEQKCTDNPFRGVVGKYEATVGSCCRYSYHVIDSAERVILFDTNPGALTNATYRLEYIDQFVGQDYTRCPCMCKHDPSKSSRRRQWWGGSGRRRRSGIRSEEEAAAVAAQASCPFAADHEDTQGTTQMPSSTSGGSVSGAVSPTPAPTPAPIVAVSGVWVIVMENASKLLSNAEGLAAFKKALEKAVTQLLNIALIEEDRIQIDISETSGHSRRLSPSSAKGLKVTYTIRVPKGVEASRVVTKINSKSTDELQASVDSALIESAKSVPDMKGLTSSAVTISAQGSLSTSPAATELSLSGRATAHGVVIVVVSLLGTMTFSMTGR